MTTAALLLPLRERRCPWRLRWIKCIRVTKPLASLRLIDACVKNSPALPSLLLHEFGPRFLSDALRAARGAGLKPFLAFGTLLGHHRDGGFIAHDADIDMGLLESDAQSRRALRAEMERHGYVTRLDNEHELAFYKPEFPTLFIDFFLFQRRGGRVFYCDRRGEVRYEYDFPAEAFDELLAVKFLGRIDAWIPSGVEAFLEASYGDWRTPRKTFDNVHDHPNLRVV